MTPRRILLACAVALVALVLGGLLYLAYGDLGRHKPWVEAFVSERAGRPFSIDGAFDLQVFPSLSVDAEHVRLGNADWAADPSMIEIGRLSTVIDLWSLVSGPVQIRSLEISDAVVHLEKGEDGRANWLIGEAAQEDGGAVRPDSGLTEVPAVIENGSLENLRLTYRQPGKPQHVAAVESLTIVPGEHDLLAIAATGVLDDDPAHLKGEIGPIDSLVSGRNIRMDLEASIGKLNVDIGGSIGRIDPLEAADIRCTVENPDVGAMLERLHFPPVATGALRAEATLEEMGGHTGLKVDAKMGDIHASVDGSLQSLGLVGSDLQFAVTVPDVSRLAKALDLGGLPRDELRIAGHMKVSGSEIELDGTTATLAGTELKIDGSVPRSPAKQPKLRFEAATQNLAELNAALPAIPVSAEGVLSGEPKQIELTELRLNLKQGELSGRASIKRTGRLRIDAELTSPHMDLLPHEKRGTNKKSGSGGKYVFPDKPLPLVIKWNFDAQVKIALQELALAAGLLKDVSGDLAIEAGRLSLEMRASGVGEGRMEGTVQVVPSQRGADLTFQASVRSVRSGFMGPKDGDVSKAPPMNLDVNLRSSGTSQRELAARATGSLLMTQGKGQLKGSILGTLGSDILTMLGKQLNPFAVDDPYTNLQCSVVRVKVVDGQATVEPVLMQSRKVTVVGNGTIDLRTEKLKFDFNTRPRKGIGITPGMFTNPFIQVGGTLAQPHLTTSAKSFASGALAVGTAGISLLAKGLLDRVAGEADLCEKTLAEVSGK
jgi:AsmA family protein